MILKAALFWLGLHFLMVYFIIELIITFLWRVLRHIHLRCVVSYGSVLKGFRPICCLLKFTREQWCKVTKYFYLFFSVASTFFGFFYVYLSTFSVK